VDLGYEDKVLGVSSRWKLLRLKNANILQTVVIDVQAGGFYLYRNCCGKLDRLRAEKALGGKPLFHQFDPDRFVQAFVGI
jgi:hypothetical protein